VKTLTAIWEVTPLTIAYTGRAIEQQRTCASAAGCTYRGAEEALIGLQPSGRPYT